MTTAPSNVSRRALRVMPAVLALIGGAAWFYRAGVRDNLVPKNFGVVDEGRVYRSGKLTPAALESVHRTHGIRTIVDLGAWEEGSAGDRREQRTADALGIERYRFDLVGDATGNPNHYVNTLRLLTDPAKQPVLVHCGAGSERTGAAVMLYRNVTIGTHIDEAYEEAKRFRHRPDRNPRLREVLDRFAAPIVEAYRAGRPIEIAGEVAPVPEPVPVRGATAGSVSGESPAPLYERAP